MSNKPDRGYYESLSEKILTYIHYISTPAMNRHPGTTFRRGIEVKAAAQDSPLKIPDTLSSRGGFVDLSNKLRGLNVGVIGVGGTGSYLIDFLAKTHVSEIRIFDDDDFKIHNVFRAPGSFVDSELGESKVLVFSERYGNVHGNIIQKKERLASDNFDLLDGLHFCFIAIDNGASRGLIARELVKRQIPFVDLGLGLFRAKHGLNGFVRTTEPRLERVETLLGGPYLPSEDPPENEYRHQAQIGELNAISAAFGMIAFKRHFGFFDQIDPPECSIFEIADGMIIDPEVHG